MGQDAHISAQTLTSFDWCGYWQGNKRQAERLAA